ncbi:MAG: hypothetical protein KBD27_00720 [Candidatus Moranbacteria bacterium]|nr:hypothetical protein [Candidatus Moranbacteria bacterium]
MKPLEKTFEAIVREEPSQLLRASILTKIGLLQSRKERHQKWFSLGMLSLSILLFSLGVYQYGQTLLQSDFLRLLSLLFSDLGVLIGSFQYFSYSLLETLPIVPLLVLLVPVVFFFWSMSLFLALSEKRGQPLFSGGSGAVGSITF